MLTIAALITPLTLAVAPMAITVEDQAKYSHQEQVIVSLNDEPIYNSTSNGTQTFDNTNGKPKDSDND
jgi:hypothetical protein